MTNELDATPRRGRQLFSVRCAGLCLFLLVAFGIGMAVSIASRREPSGWIRLPGISLAIGLTAEPRSSGRQGFHAFIPTPSGIEPDISMMTYKLGTGLVIVKWTRSDLGRL